MTEEATDSIKNLVKCQQKGAGEDRSMAGVRPSSVQTAMATGGARCNMPVEVDDAGAPVYSGRGVHDDRMWFAIAVRGRQH